MRKKIKKNPEKLKEIKRFFDAFRWECIEMKDHSFKIYSVGRLQGGMEREMNSYEV